MKKLLKSIFLVDLLKGLWLTLKYTPQPAFTFQYPAERRPVAPRFRGVLRLQVEPESGAQTCIVCDQCAKACPDDLIALGGHREAGQKIKILDYFDFNLSRCSFCGLCSEVCPTKPVKAFFAVGPVEQSMMMVDEHYRDRRALHGPGGNRLGKIRAATGEGERHDEHPALTELIGRPSPEQRRHSGHQLCRHLRRAEPHLGNRDAGRQAGAGQNYCRSG